MEAIAKALVSATQYINERGDKHTSDDDVKALEAVASMLQQATPLEKAALMKIARELGLHKWPEQVGIA